MYSPDGDNLRLSVTHILYQCHALPSAVLSSRRCNGFICYVKGEGQDFDFGDRVYHARLGDFLYLPHGASYTNRKLSEDTEYYEIDFFLYDEKNDPYALFETPYIVPRQEAGEYFRLVKEIFDTSSDLEPSRSFLYFGNICRLADMLRTSKSTCDRETYGINRILRSVTHLREHFDKDTPLAELAEMSSMSVSSLEKIFKKSFGLSPIAYRNLLRVNHAKSLLLNGYSIGESADKVGFSNYFYFCKLFKARTGLSPGEYAKLAH